MISKEKINKAKTWSFESTNESTQLPPRLAEEKKRGKLPLSWIKRGRTQEIPQALKRAYNKHCANNFKFFNEKDKFPEKWCTKTDKRKTENLNNSISI